MKVTKADEKPLIQKTFYVSDEYYELDGQIFVLTEADERKPELIRNHHYHPNPYSQFPSPSYSIYLNDDLKPIGDKSHNQSSYSITFFLFMYILVLMCILVLCVISI